MNTIDYMRMDFVPDFIVGDSTHEVDVRDLNTNILLMGEEARTEDVYLDKLEQELSTRSQGDIVFEREQITLSGLP